MKRTHPLSDGALVWPDRASGSSQNLNQSNAGEYSDVETLIRGMPQEGIPYSLSREYVWGEIMNGAQGLLRVEANLSLAGTGLSRPGGAHRCQWRG